MFGTSAHMGRYLLWLGPLDFSCRIKTRSAFVVLTVGPTYAISK